MNRAKSMLDLFEFKGNQVRFVDGKPVANDVASILGYADPANAVNRIVDKEYLTLCKIQTVEGGITKERKINVIVEEAGIYQLIFMSKLPIAKEFQKWVFEVVLPSIRKTGSYSVNQAQSLPCHVVAVQKARAIAEIEDVLINQPKLAQFLIDHTISDLIEQKQLTGDELRGVVEVAKEMGFAVDMGNRSALGKFVRSQLSDEGKQEKRLVNGEMRSVWCYPDNDKLRKVITEYFN
jgi:prophage antirepressor-like protein